MELKQTVLCLAALAQETRLAVFRLLVEAGPEGLCAGDIGGRLGVPAATLSFHLAQLANAGLVSARQQSRFIFYSANFEAMNGIAIADARSKSWDEFAVSGGLTFDFIFTVCDNAANEACPVWPGHPATAHWGIPYPAHVGPIEARREAFESAYRQLKRRVEAFLALPLETMSREEAIAAARRIHEEH